MAGLEASPELLEAARTYGRLQTLASKSWWVGDPYRKRVNSKVNSASVICEGGKLGSACEELRVFSQMDGEAEEKMKEAFGWIRRPAKGERKQEWLATGIVIQEIGAGKGKQPRYFHCRRLWSFGGGEGVAPRFFAQYHPRLVSGVFKGGIAPNLEARYMNRDSTSSFNRVK